MNFETFLESFNKNEAATHLATAKNHPVGSKEHNHAMANHHAQMFWHHTHAGEHGPAKAHLAKMHHFESGMK